VIKIVGYTWKDIFSVFVPCLKVTAVAVIVPMLSFLYLTFDNQFASLLTIDSISILSVGLFVWVLGLNKKMKAKVVEMVKKKNWKIKIRQKRHQVRQKNCRKVKKILDYSKYELYLCRK